MRVVTIVQARTASSRLPGKVLLPIGDETVLDIVVSRCRRIRDTHELVVATSNNPQDVPIIDHVSARGIEVFAGSESDVLDRFYSAAIAYQADAVVRITADCPMLDPDVSSRVVARFLQGDCDYASNIKPPTFPDGLDTEVVSISALEQAFEKATLPSHREHVTPYIWQNPDKFRLANIESAVDLSHLRWTLDNADDLQLMREISRRLHVPFSSASLNDFLQLWETDTDLATMSSTSQRNESLEAQMKSEG